MLQMMESSMSGCPEQVILAEALENSEELKNRGFSVTCEGAGAVVIDFAHHVRGFWDCQSGVYLWTDVGSRQPSFRTYKLETAVKQTLKMFVAADEAREA